METDRVKDKRASQSAVRLIRMDVCAVCQRPEPLNAKKHEKLHLDHDHANGQPRSLLCMPCNTALGHMREDPPSIERLLSYAKWCRAVRQAIALGDPLPVWEGIK